MKKMMICAATVAMLLSMTGCSNDAAESDSVNRRDNPIESVEKPERNDLKKSYNVPITDNDILRMEWLEFTGTGYTVEITNKSGKELYLWDCEYELVNHQPDVKNCIGAELAPGESTVFTFMISEEACEQNIDCVSFEVEAYDYPEGKDGDQCYMGAFCLLLEEGAAVPFDAENCEHTAHGHRNPVLFENENVVINYVGMGREYERVEPVISITSTTHTPIDWWMFIMSIVNEKGEDAYVYGPTALYPFIENGVRYTTLMNDGVDWPGTWTVTANSTDGEFTFTFTMDEDYNVTVE